MTDNNIDRTLGEHTQILKQLQNGQAEIRDILERIQDSFNIVCQNDKVQDEKIKTLTERIKDHSTAIITIIVGAFMAFMAHIFGGKQ